MRLLSLTKPFMTGPDVVHAQTMLHANRYADFFQFKIDGQFGPVTANRCAAAKWWLGYPVLDPVYGDQLDGYLRGDHPLPTDYEKRRQQHLRKRTLFRCGVKQIKRIARD